jgi:hypothetical protein
MEAGQVSNWTDRKFLHSRFLGLEFGKCQGFLVTIKNAASGWDPPASPRSVRLCRIYDFCAGNRFVVVVPDYACEIGQNEILLGLLRQRLRTAPGVFLLTRDPSGQKPAGDF